MPAVTASRVKRSIIAPVRYMIDANIVAQNDPTLKSSRMLCDAFLNGIKKVCAVKARTATNVVKPTWCSCCSSLVENIAMIRAVVALRAIMTACTREIDAKKLAILYVYERSTGSFYAHT